MEKADASDLQMKADGSGSKMHQTALHGDSGKVVPVTSKASDPAAPGLMQVHEPSSQLDSGKAYPAPTRSPEPPVDVLLKGNIAYF